MLKYFIAFLLTSFTAHAAYINEVKVTNFPATQPVSLVSVPLAPNASTLTEQQTQTLKLIDLINLATTISTGVNVNNFPAVQNVDTGVTKKALSAQLVSSDISQVSASVIHGITTGGGGGYVDVKVTPSGALVTESTISGTGGLALDTSVNSLLKPASTLAAVTTLGSITNTVTIKADTPANQTNALKVDGSGTTQPISGSVSVSNFPATQNVNVTNQITGFATAANQTTANASLSSIDSKLTSPLTVQGTVTANLGTIAGVATAANQTTANASLSSIDSKLTSPLTVTTTGVQRTPSFTITSTTGTVSAGAKSVAFYNSGAANATVAGSTLAPFEFIRFAVTGSDTLAAITYTATGTTLKITEVR